MEQSEFQGISPRRTTARVQAIARFKYLLLLTDPEKCMADPDQDDYQNQADDDAPADKFFLDRQQRLIFHFLDFVRELGLLHKLSLTGNRRFHAMEKQPRNKHPNPDNKTEQAYDIYQGKFPDALLPELTEIRNHADGEKGHHEKYAAKYVGLTHGGPGLTDQVRCEQSHDNDGKKRRHVAQNEFGETVPDLSKPDFFAGSFFDFRRPDPG